MPAAMPDLSTEAGVYQVILFGFLAVALLIFPLLFFVSAPYGRHAREGWGPKLNATFGWIVMEAPSPVVFFLCYWLGDPAHTRTPAAVAFLLVWLAHYVNRAFVFPLRRRGGQKDMPLTIFASSFAFNCLNGYVNGRWLFTLGPVVDGSWLADPRFLVGLSLFATGYFINQQSDHILFNLRRPGETGYKVPRGGFYRFVSCPNYFGEILEWSGWALLTWSLPGLAFAIWTAANLVPRARTHHRWYLDKFSDYPRERRAVLPYLF